MVALLRTVTPQPTQLDLPPDPLVAPEPAVCVLDNKVSAPPLGYYNAVEPLGGRLPSVRMPTLPGSSLRMPATPLCGRHSTGLLPQLGQGSMTSLKGTLASCHLQASLKARDDEPYINYHCKDRRSQPG